MDEKDKQCALIFDEMSLKCGLTYDSAMDCIEGFEDYGGIRKTQYIADHALVFMTRGLKNKWKQPVCYFLKEPYFIGGH